MGGYAFVGLDDDAADSALEADDGATAAIAGIFGCQLTKGNGSV